MHPATLPPDAGPLATSHPGGSIATAQRVFHEMDGVRVGLAWSSRDANRFIRALAELQHGVVARRQLLAVGLGKGLVQERLATGRLIRLHQGVYAVGHRRFDMPHLWMAAVLACGDRAALSHRSAAHLWGLRRSRGPVEVTRLSGGRPRPGILLRQTSVLEGVDLTADRRIPVTTLERTLLDLASEFDVRALERLLVEADRSGQLSWRSLELTIERGKGLVGVARLRRVAGSVDPQAIETRSPLEVDFLGLCREAGLPPPEVGVMVKGILVDFFWPAQRVIVETDGYKFHNDRLAFENDHQRTIHLEIAGYCVHRTTYRMLDKEPAPFLGLVRRSLQVNTPTRFP